MECQECFGAVLITRTSDDPLVNRPLTLRSRRRRRLVEWMRLREPAITAEKCAFMHPRLP